MDVICIDNWIKKMQWTGSFYCGSIDNEGLYGFLNAPRISVSINGVPNGFVKSYQNFSLWNILNAGHMVPYGRIVQTKLINIR